jgi:RNA polymerase sigma factor FliA
MRTLVADALEDLDVKERQVITLYYLKELTMKKVGAVLGIGESRVSQIHSAALVRIRSRMAVSMRAPTLRSEPTS